MKFQITLLVGLLSAQIAMADFDADKTYVIASNKFPSYYVGETSGKLAPVAFSEDAAIFWQFEPTGNENCYYIKNTSTGNYVQKVGSQGASISTGTDPVEYYIGENSGTYRFTSTNCTNYATTTSNSPYGWNYNTTGPSIVVWKAGTGNGQSWWTVKAYPFEEEHAEAGIYTISSVKTPLYYMNCEADGTMTVCTYDVAQRIFWELIPTDNEDCFYIRNTANNYYIQSCAGTTGASHIMQAGTEPVEFYVSVENSQVRFTSTDCDNYDNTSAAPNGLNRSGSADYVIVYAAGSSNTNSWWKLNESEDLYEAQPFEPSKSVGNPAQEYYVQNADGQYLSLGADGTLTWVDELDETTCVWYFVGTGNRAGGYLLVNSNGDVVYGSTDQRYCIYDADTNGYEFRDATTDETLAPGGQSVIVSFKAKRSDYAKSAQIYDLPCATLAKPYIQSLSLAGDAALTPLTYPVSKVQNGSVTAKSTTPTAGYTLFTESKATLRQGLQATLSVSLTAALANGQQMLAYFDWDRDGLFEIALPLSPDATTATQTVNIPADATLGQSRMRLRITENNLLGADDETVGQVLDCIVNVVADDGSDYTVSLSTNDPERGTATLSTEAENTAIASPIGGAEFICWKEGNNVVSVDTAYTFTLDHNVSLTAYFGPVPADTTETGIHTPLYAENHLVGITARNHVISVDSPTPVSEIRVYSPNAQLVARGKGNTLSVPALIDGVYIVRVITTRQNASAKVIIK